MDAPSTPPQRFTRPRTPPTPLHGDAYNGLHPYKPASPPASPAPPARPQMHGGSKSARSGDNDATPSDMLPSPSKTPSLTPAQKRARTSSMQYSPRALHFLPENPNDSMPTPRIARKNHYICLGDDDNGLDIGRPKKSAKSDIQIYTEVQARVPEDDSSDDNVFRDVPRGRTTTVSEPVYQNRGGGDWDSPSPPRQRPRKTVDELVEEARMQAAVNRGEGMFFMYRGKKCFRKFADVEDTEDAGASSREQQQLKRAIGHSARRGLTRSNIEPRLLWPQASQTSYTDEEAETDVDMPDQRIKTTESQEHDSGVSFAGPAVHATPVKQSKAKRKPMISPPTTARTTRQSHFDEVPSFEETLEADDEAPAEPILPTPQRSSRKKKVTINDFPVFEDHPSDTAVPSTPGRARNTRNEPQLTPIVEGSEEPVSAGNTSPTVASSDRRSKRSPFDSWQRTKTGTKRGAVADAAGDGKVKCPRSSTRSNPSRA